MACPNIANSEITMLKTARERKYSNYDGNGTITSPIYMSDIQRLSGGNSSGSGTSYPPVAMGNPETNRPDGENPLQMSEFSLYDQNPPRTAFYYIYDSSSSGSACNLGIPEGPYYHTDPNNLYPDDLTGIYTAYTTQTGTTPVSSGYYQIYNSDFSTTGKYIYVGSNGAITGGGNC